jgi:hypothetical protein
MGALVAFVIVLVAVVYLVTRFIVLRNVLRRNGENEGD